MKMITLMLMMLADAGSAATPDVQLLDFTASYCEPCQRMLPILQKMEHDGYPIRRIDITEEHELARRFEVDRVPTLVLMVEGKEVKRFVGLRDGAELRSEMNKAARQLSEARHIADPPAAPKQSQPEQSAEPDKSAEAQLTAEARPSIKGIFRNIFGGDTKPGPFEYPRFRGQSPESSPERLQGLQTAAAATVRVRVVGISTKDGKKILDVGTGTIVYSAVGQAIVLTCAHVFLDIAENDAAVEVEVFGNGNVDKFPATLIGGDHASDIALLRIQTSKILPFVRLNSTAPRTEKGQGLVSFGCNDGANPTQLETKLVDINRYDGPAHLVCTTDPKSGRSGGGLFDANGSLVGVCSCADRPHAEGLYMAHAAILKFVADLKDQKLQSILLAAPTGGGEDAASSFADLMEGKPPGEKNTAIPAAVATASENVRAAAPPAFDESAASSGQDDAATQDRLPNEGKVTDLSSFASTAHDPFPTSSAARTDSSGPQLTITINDQTPGSQARTIVIPHASSWMMELLTGESFDAPAPSMTTALRPLNSTLSVRTSANQSKIGTATSH